MRLVDDMIRFAQRGALRRVQSFERDALANQRAALERVLRAARGTLFGRDHALEGVRDYATYRRAVPLRAYPEFARYWESIADGAPDVLLRGRPLYWAKTGGTTGAEKLVPIYRASLEQSRRSFELALATHMHDAPEARIVGTKVLFLGSCAALEQRDGMPTGFMSSLMAREMSPLVRSMIVPGQRVDHLPDWSDKTRVIFELLKNERVSVIAGMPPWLAAFLRYVVDQTGRPACELWPDLSLVLHSGVAMDHYRENVQALLTGAAHRPGPRFMNAFGATEGNLAFQRDAHRSDMLLVSDDVFFEFVPLDDLLAGRAERGRCALADVRTGEDYALVLNTPGGLRGYLLGDTVRFTSLAPHRFVISGRTSQALNHAGEKVSVEQLGRALSGAACATGAVVHEYCLCPIMRGLDARAEGCVPGHRWYVEFERDPASRRGFIEALDRALCAENPLYAVRRSSQLGRTPLLAAPELVVVARGGFRALQAGAGREGGHFKLPRITTSERCRALEGTMEDGHDDEIFGAAGVGAQALLGALA